MHSEDAAHQSYCCLDCVAAHGDRIGQVVVLDIIGWEGVGEEGEGASLDVGVEGVAIFEDKLVGEVEADGRKQQKRFHANKIMGDRNPQIENAVG